MSLKDSGECKMKRLRILIVLCVTALFCFANSANERAAGAETGKKYNILVSAYPPIDQFISCQNTMIKWYGEDHNVNVFWAPDAPDCTGELQVTNALGILKTTHIDGIVLCSPSAKPQKAITDYAKTEKIPVIGFQEPTDSPDLLMFVGTVPNLQGRAGGEAMKAALKAKFGEVKGKVLVVDTTPASVTHHSRTLGFLAVLKDEPNVKVDTIEVRNITPESTKEAVSTYLALGNTLDAAWGPSGAMPQGIIQALKDYPGANIQDKIIIGSEAYTTIMEGIRAGYVKAATAPAAQYLGVIAFKYLLDYLDGKPLPAKGSTINDFSLEGGKPRKGFDPWRADYIKAAVLPATVTTLQEAIKDYPALKQSYTYDYPVWSINVPYITKKDENAPWVWGNFPYDWAVEVR